jgi:murein DD-endopeptidase MepM/ murein hydrolase activator NlpD
MLVLPASTSARRDIRALAAAALLSLVVVVAFGGPARAVDDEPETLAGWRWPVHPFRIVEAFVAPAHEYGPGHRGVDIAPSDPAGVISSPAAGVIAFAGPVAGRGVVTIDHGGGLVTTLEPVSPEATVGEAVVAGEPVGTLSTGGHTPPGALHFGVRLDGEYINPLLLLGGVPRAVLLPCCEPIAAAQPMVLRSPASSISPMPLAAATVLSWPVTATESIPVSDRTVLRSPDTVAAVISSASTTTS